MTQTVEPRLSNNLGDLLSVASINKLVIIDDSFFNSENSIEDSTLIVFISAQSHLFFEVIPGLKDIEETDQILNFVRTSIEDEQIRRQIVDIYVNNQSDAKDALKAEAPDTQTMAILKDLINKLPAGYAIENLNYSGSEWEKNSASLLEEHGNGTLFLIDRDFTSEGKSEDFGLNLIHQLQNLNQSNNYIALLSHTFLPGSEIELWSQLADKHGLQKDRFVIISKSRLANDKPDIEGFLHLVKLAILCGPLKNLRDLVKDHYIESISQTRECLDKWTVFDFDEAIFGSSRREGIWEGDTLIRVISTFTNKMVKNKVNQDSNVRELISFARKASLVNIPKNSRHIWPGVGEMALEYQRLELYFDADSINQHYLPIERKRG